MANVLNIKTHRLTEGFENLLDILITAYNQIDKTLKAKNMKVIAVSFNENPIRSYTGTATVEPTDIEDVILPIAFSLLVHTDKGGFEVVVNVELNVAKFFARNYKAQNYLIQQNADWDYGIDTRKLPFMLDDVKSALAVGNPSGQNCYRLENDTWKPYNPTQHNGLRDTVTNCLHLGSLGVAEKVYDIVSFFPIKDTSFLAKNVILDAIAYNNNAVNRYNQNNADKTMKIKERLYKSNNGNKPYYNQVQEMFKSKTKNLYEYNNSMIFYSFKNNEQEYLFVGNVFASCVINLSKWSVQPLHNLNDDSIELAVQRLKPFPFVTKLIEVTDLRKAV